MCCRASKRSRPLCFAGVELLSFSGQLPGLIFLFLLFWCGVQRYFARLRRDSLTGRSGSLFREPA